MIQKIKNQWFLLSLVFIFAAVIFDRSNNLTKIGIILKDNNGPEVMVFIIFIISGLLIESDQLKSGIKDVKSTLLSLIVIIFFAPVAAGLLCLFPLEICCQQVDFKFTRFPEIYQTKTPAFSPFYIRTCGPYFPYFFVPTRDGISDGRVLLYSPDYTIQIIFDAAKLLFEDFYGFLEG
jgi:hypothetical protein